MIATVPEILVWGTFRVSRYKRPSGFKSLWIAAVYQPVWKRCCRAIPVDTGWLLLCLWSTDMDVGIQDWIECGEGIVPLLAGMCTYLEGVVSEKSPVYYICLNVKPELKVFVLIKTWGKEKRYNKKVFLLEPWVWKLPGLVWI